MENMYPYVESLKVCISYVALLYLWPSIVFHKFLRGKGATFRFMFCAAAMPLLMNTVVLGLGLFRLLNIWLVRMLFWGTLAVSAGKPLLEWGRNSPPPWGLLLKKGCGWKMFCIRKLETVGTGGKNFWRTRKEHWLEYALLAVIVLFGCAFFSIGAFQMRSYGCGDQFVHHRWILGLQRGEAFSGGIYPEAMHCFLYGMSGLFGVDLFSCILFLPGIHVSAFLVAAYCLLKEVYQCRYMPLFVLTAWLVTGETMWDMGEALSRMTWTLPQEFSLYLMFLCPLALLRFVRRGNTEKKWFQNDDLLMLSLITGTAIATHFFAAALALLFGLILALNHLRKLWQPEKLRLLAVSVLSGAEAALIPMVLAFVAGKQTQGSLNWAVTVLLGTFEEFAASFRDGTVWGFGENGGWWIVLAVVASLAVAGAGICLLRRRGGRESSPVMEQMKSYAFLVEIAAVFVLLCGGPTWGILDPVIVERITGIMQLLAFSVCGAAVDFLLFLLPLKLSPVILRIVGLAGCVAIYTCARLTNFHAYTHWYMNRYPAEAAVTEEVVDRFSQESYVVASFNSEPYQGVREASHINLYDFMQNLEGKGYYLPAEYIFLYVEKKPIPYGEYYLTGPSWLAAEDEAIAENFDRQSDAPAISPVAATQRTAYSPSSTTVYIILWDQETIYSKLYLWFHDFSRLYPMDTEIYYEDDEFVCYVIHQDPEAPFDLAIKGK